MNQREPDVELRFAELQTQIDTLAMALHQRGPEGASPSEGRLSELVEKCQAALHRWATLDARHEQVVAALDRKLNDWSEIESRLELDSGRRLRQLEELIEHEGQALRSIHAEPVRQLREQAANLEETCVAAAHLALRGFERAEQRVAALEADLQSRLNYLTARVEAAGAEVRGGAASSTRALPPQVTPFDLESVMRIHDEVRRTNEARHADNGSVVEPSAGGTSYGLSVVDRQLPATGSSPSNPPDAAAVEPAERPASPPAPVVPAAGAVPATATGTEPPRRRRFAWMAAAAAVLAFVALGIYLQQRLERRLNEASARITAAEQRAEEAKASASREIASSRDDAAKRISEARDTARQAEIVSQILAAPDLARYSLAGAASAPAAYGQLLWSRSRGLVFSASRLPAAPPGSAYQLWLFTPTGPINAGTFLPDAAGRAAVTLHEPPAVPRTLTGVAATLEKPGGVTRPSGPVMLARVQ